MTSIYMKSCKGTQAANNHAVIMIRLGRLGVYNVSSNLCRNTFGMFTGLLRHDVILTAH